ncbi:hypothetical protein [Herpetosiphon geysericola]|uniref:Uncharacterized protein n=1 Tax=Herpetosiphon geysericola TaxID=70996 RepID=A0A0P6XCJ7_9CHLR|nr:hypothetical protein [Herpetosiphon geysericola]KPL80206.1 hypothetical protein SE18_24425 [Herpetosiphon geysericola]
MYRKMIVYDRTAQDFLCYLDGELRDRKPTYVEAEQYLNKLVYTLLTRPATETERQAAIDISKRLSDKHQPT